MGLSLKAIPPQRGDQLAVRTRRFITEMVFFLGFPRRLTLASKLWWLALAYAPHSIAAPAIAVPELDEVPPAVTPNPAAAAAAAAAAARAQEEAARAKEEAAAARAAALEAAKRAARAPASTGLDPARADPEEARAEADAARAAAAAAAARADAAAATAARANADAQRVAETQRAAAEDAAKRCYGLCKLMWTKVITVGPGLPAASFRFDGKIGFADRVAPVEVGLNLLQRTYNPTAENGAAGKHKITFLRVSLGLTVTKNPDNPNVTFGGYITPLGLQVDSFAVGVGLAYAATGETKSTNENWSIVVPFTYTIQEFN